MTKVRELTSYLEHYAPLPYQESYDNAGLIAGNPEMEIRGVLISLDATEDVIAEAIRHQCNLIISHHPIIFKGLKKITGRNYVERTVIKAIKNDVALYAIHTNLDSISSGVNARICRQLELNEMKILVSRRNTLSKLVTFVPDENHGQVLEALYEAGAGHIGKYDHCSFTIPGTGSFRPDESANPHIGNRGEEESVSELRVEVIFPKTSWTHIKAALYKAHPYEEVAYYLTDLVNEDLEVGSGMIGMLSKSMEPLDFLTYLKKKVSTPLIRHTAIHSAKKIQKIAVCGGSGSFLIPAAIQQNADVFITADVKYHEFFDADGEIIIADIGHYESEVFTKDLIHDLLMKKFNTFALRLSETDTNPVKYF